MVKIYQKQPSGSLRGPITWYLFLGWEDEPGGVPIYKPVSFDDTGTPYNPKTPLAPTVSATLTSRTTGSVTWTPATQIGPAISEWDVEVRTSTDDGANYGAWGPLTGSPFAPNVFTAPLSGLAVGTPEIRFQFRARGQNADGIGDWSTTFEVQWGGTVQNPPNPPRALVVGVITATSVQLSWTPPATGSTTDGATKHGIFSGNTDLHVDIDKNATSFLWNTLTPRTNYQNINIRRFNAGGWSGGTNQVDFRTPGVRLTVDDVAMGQSVPDNRIAYRTSMPAVRAYSMSDALTFVGQYNSRVVGVTEPGGKSGGNVDALETALIRFYEGAGSDARQDVEYHYAEGNEIDKDGAGYSSGQLPTAYINAYADLRQVIHQTQGGVRRFPKASLWVDMTANNLKNFGSGPRFLPIARYLDGMAVSAYPSGRTIQSSNPLIEYDPASYPAGSQWNGLARNAYAFYVDPIFTALALWRSQGGPGGTAIRDQLNMFAVWEIGIPIHHSLPSGNLSNLVRTGTNPTDITQRPRYLVGGKRVTGPANQQYNMKGLLNYIWEKCDAEDVAMREMLYWNQWSNTPDDDTPDTSIPNPWQADAGKTDPDSVTAWYLWHPGYSLPDI